jgi:hypothetical protein
MNKYKVLVAGKSPKFLTQQDIENYIASLKDPYIIIAPNAAAVYHLNS